MKKTADYYRDYYRKNRDKINARTLAWYHKNKERIREQRKNWPSQHKAKEGTPPLTKTGLPDKRWGRKWGIHRDTKKAYMREYVRLPERVDRRRLRYQERGPRPRPGWTRESRAEALLRQAGDCAICGRPFGTTPHQDHDEMTGKSRALLCSSCNLMLGKSGDSPEILRAAADYIERYRHTIT